MKEQCRERIGTLEAAAVLQLKTGTDSELILNLEGRSWYSDTGDGDLPCGEVYIAPVEEKTQGSVWFESLYLEGRKYEHVRLWIQNGVAVSSSDAELEEFLQELPEAGRVVCEFGLGMNPGVCELCGEAYLDEKAAGTFHIALGDNTMFGGLNEAPLHLDLVGWGEWKTV